MDTEVKVISPQQLHTLKMNQDEDDDDEHCCEERSQIELIISQYPLVVSFLATNVIYLITLLGLYKFRAQPTRRTLKHNLLNGLISSLTSAFLSNPLWVAKWRLGNRRHKQWSESGVEKCYCGVSKSIVQLIKENNILAEVIDVAQCEGVGGLWRGSKGSLLLASINSPLQTIIYEAMLEQVRRTSAKTTSTTCARHHALPAKLATIISLLVVSRCTTAAITYPLHLAQSTKRRQPRLYAGQSLLGILRGIIADRGPTGLYHGLEIKLWQTLLLTALLAVTSPKIFMPIVDVFQLRQMIQKKFKIKL